MGRFLATFHKQADARTLGKIYSLFRGSPSHLKLYNDLVLQARRYRSSIEALERTAKNVHQLGRGDLSMVEAADRGRHLAHNSFISHLQSVTRNAAERGVDVHGMRPHLESRERATDFALEIARRFRPVHELKRAA